MKLSSKDFRKLENHYTGNCFGCERCSYYERLTREPADPTAPADYVAYMREHHPHEQIELEPS